MQKSLNLYDILTKFVYVRVCVAVLYTTTENSLRLAWDAS
jgi:hypothetical protein